MKISKIIYILIIDIIIMNLGNYLFMLPSIQKDKYRAYEKVSKKLINAEWSIKFNKICLKENLMPTYVRFRHHDPALSNVSQTIDYRKYLIEREIEKSKNKCSLLKKQKQEILVEISEFDVQDDAKRVIDGLMNAELSNSDNVHKTKTLKKLNKLYAGSIFLKEEKSYFVNLSNYNPTETEIEFLNLGLNFHIQPRYDKLNKETELELLYQKLLNLEKDKKIVIKPGLPEKIQAEATKHRNPRHHNSIITKELRQAAQSLYNNQDIVIRKADKSSIFVILNKYDYLSKINAILSDNSKFRKIENDPTNELKSKANKLISTLNASQSDVKLSKIVGDFSPGYIYGNVKTHKNNNPIRPIISQIPTATYQTAKKLNTLLKPYLPDQYTIRSTNDFIDILQTNRSQGVIASLDVESLFTNVPIDATIDIILQRAYNHATLPKLKIPPLILKQLLELCTKHAPFKTPTGELYLQMDGIAMGSPLGPLFANFYAGNLEENVFNNHFQKPHIYTRYVDEIFLQIDTEQQIIQLKEIFEQHSVLRFTHEMNIDNKLPFLDVMIDSNETQFKTTIYRRPTSIVTCGNGDSEYAEKFKISVIQGSLL